MKKLENIIQDRTKRIESNNLKILNYKNHHEIYCKCNLCGYKIINNHRNLSRTNFKCKYCILLSTSYLLKNKEVKLIKINNLKILLECKNGHVYEQDRRNLLANKKCKQCYINNKLFDINKVHLIIKELHGDNYEYDFKDFKNLHSKIKIKCKKNHIFKQKVSNHLQGKGCPICRESIGERKISKFLEEVNIKYIKQKKFDNCRFKEKLSFDFFIPSISIAIEYDGIQHFKPVEIFGGKSEFEKNKIRDNIKNEYCKNNNIHLIRISYLDNIEEKLLHINKLIIFQS